MNRDSSQWTLKLRRSLAGVRIDATLGSTETQSLTRFGSRTSERDETTRKSRLAFDWDALHTESSRLRLRGGVSKDQREQLHRPDTTVEDLFVDPTLELLSQRLRFNLRLSIRRFERPGERNEERESVRATVAFRLHQEHALELSMGFDWSQHKNLLHPIRDAAKETDRRWSFALSWAPDWLIGN